MEKVLPNGMHFDFTAWPIVQITQVGACSDEQVVAYLAEMRKLYERDTDYAVLLDLRRGVPFNSKQRAMQSAWLSQSSDRVHHIAGIAFIEDSFFMRGAMQAAFWLNPPAYPFLVTKHFEEGMDWARAKYAARGKAAA